VHRATLSLTPSMSYDLPFILSRPWLILDLGQLRSYTIGVALTRKMMMLARVSNLDWCSTARILHLPSLVVRFVVRQLEGELADKVGSGADDRTHEVITSSERVAE
jgi:hypothetical protein